MFSCGVVEQTLGIGCAYRGPPSLITTVTPIGEAQGQGHEPRAKASAQATMARPSRDNAYMNVLKHYKILYVASKGIIVHERLGGHSLTGSQPIQEQFSMRSEGGSRCRVHCFKKTAVHKRPGAQSLTASLLIQEQVSTRSLVGQLHVVWGLGFRFLGIREPSFGLYLGPRNPQSAFAFAPEEPSRSCLPQNSLNTFTLTFLATPGHGNLPGNCFTCFSETSSRSSKNFPNILKTFPFPCSLFISLVEIIKLP